MTYISEIFLIDGFKYLHEIDVEIKSIILSEADQETRILQMNTRLSKEKANLNRANANVSSQQLDLKAYKQNIGKNASPGRVLAMNKNVAKWTSQATLHNAGIKRWQLALKMLKKVA